MDAVRVLASQLAQMPSVRSETAVFLGMTGGLARILIGTNAITAPCVGFYPPVQGMTVQVEWRDGRPSVTGPAAPKAPIGTVTAVEPPKATVDVAGELFALEYRLGYSPAVGDVVEINWATGVIQGALSSTPVPEPEPEVPPVVPQPFDVQVRATDSGRYQSSWWGNDPWASSSNRGIWVYGDRIRDAVRGAASFNSLEVFLPLISELGLCQIGIAQHSSIPGGAPTITDLVDLPSGRRSGWQGIPHTWLDQLAQGGRGIGVLAPGGAGYTRWRGTQADPASGALRIRGTR